MIEDHRLIHDEVVAGGVSDDGPPTNDRAIALDATGLARSARKARVQEQVRASLISAGYTVSAVLLGLLVWTVAAAIVNNRLLPSPIAVAEQAWTLTQNGTLLPDIQASVSRVLVGFAIGSALAIPIGFLMGWYRPVRGLVEPWIQFFRAIPALALIPFVVLAAGIGEEAKILVIGLAAFLATVVGTIQGVVDVERTLINAARVLGASDGTIFARVVIPASLPYILVGMRIGLGNSWATVVAAELIAASSGLGFLTQQSALYFEIKSIFVAVMSIGIIGVVMDRFILLSQSRLTRWQERR